MIDFHSHILPNIDDGCKSVAESVKALELLYQSGVRKVMLTPHYYIEKESIDEFLLRREKSYTILKEAVDKSQSQLPEICLGAEVKFFYGISQMPDIKKLCYENSKCILLELPFEKLNLSIYNEVRNLQGRQGIIVLIAHFNRYIPFGNSFKEIISLGCPLQLNGEVFEKKIGKRKWLKYMREEDVVLGSDCHNLSTRKPNIDKAILAFPDKYREAFMCKIDNIGDMLLNT